MSEKKHPYLSIVAVTRNDDHGGGLLERTQIFVNDLMERLQCHGLPSEIIIVEWNPPRDRPSLAEALNWPSSQGSCAVRVITVDRKTHRRFRHFEQLQLFQMIGKNVAIRRSRGRFVLATNIDVLMSDALADFLASRKLDPEKMYRIDRYDVANGVPLHATPQERQDFCRRNVIRIFKRHTTTLFHEQDTSRENFLQNPLGIVKRSLLSPLFNRLFTLHTNACGDFTLLSREKWFSLRGYAEWEMYSMHLDSLLCYAAHTANAQEVVLPDPLRLYHMEHAPGSGWQPGKGERLLFNRLAESGIPRISNAKLWLLCFRMIALQRPIIFNPPDWGLPDIDFAEWRLA